MRTMSRRDMYLAKRITMQMGNVSAAMKPITSTRDRGGAVIEKGAIVKADGNQGKVTAITSDDGIIAVEVLIKGRKVIYGPGQLTVITTARPDVSAATLVKFICADRNTANRLARQALAAKVPGLRVDGDTGVMVPQKSVNALKKVADQEGITVTQQGGNVSASALDFELITKMITGNQRASEIADYYSDRVGFSERQWDMLVDGRYSKLFDLRDPMSKLKLVQAMSKMRNVTLPPELSGKKPPTVSASVTQPRMRAYDFSFSNDLDRELFITEVEAMRFPAGTKPPHLETWNASATVWANDPRVVAAAQRIARGYYGVKMSNALPVSAADDGGFLSNGFSFITPEKGKQFAKIVKSKFPMMQVRLMSNDQVVDVSHIDPEDDDQLIKIARKIDPGVRTSAPYAASFEKNDKGQVMIPRSVAEEGARLADEQMRADREQEDKSNSYSDKKYSKLKRAQKLAPELKKAADAALKVYYAARDKSDAFEKKYGVSVVEAWEALHGQRWRYYRVDSTGKTSPDAVMIEASRRPVSAASNNASAQVKLANAIRQYLNTHEDLSERTYERLEQIRINATNRKASQQDFQDASELVGIEVSASLAPVAMGSLDLTLPSAAHAQRFAAAAMKLGTKVQYEGSRVRCSYDHKHGPALMSLASQAHRGQAAAAATPPPINPSKQFVYRFPDHASLEQFLQAAKQLSGLRAISKSATTARMEGDATKLWRLAEQFDGVRA